MVQCVLLVEEGVRALACATRDSRRSLPGSRAHLATADMAAVGGSGGGGTCYPGEEGGTGKRAHASPGPCRRRVVRGCRPPRRRPCLPRHGSPPSMTRGGAQWSRSVATPGGGRRARALIGQRRALAGVASTGGARGGGHVDVAVVLSPVLDERRKCANHAEVKGIEGRGPTSTAARWQRGAHEPSRSYVGGGDGDGELGPPTPPR